MAILDIEKAFDYMHRQTMMECLRERGWLTTAIRILSEHINGLRADAELSGAPDVEEFAYDLGGRQGGANTGTVFADIIEAIIQPIIK